MRQSKIGLIVITLLALSMQGCFPRTVEIPVAVECLPFPTPPAQLMTPPAISDFSKYYEPLKTKPSL